MRCPALMGTHQDDYWISSVRSLKLSLCFPNLRLYQRSWHCAEVKLTKWQWKIPVQWVQGLQPLQHHPKTVRPSMVRVFAAHHVYWLEDSWISAVMAGWRHHMCFHSRQGYGWTSGCWVEMGCCRRPAECHLARIVISRNLSLKLLTALLLCVHPDPFPKLKETIASMNNHQPESTLLNCETGKK